VAKAEWGQKRICPSCSARYYDMKKKTPVCPTCGTTYDPENVMKARRGKVAAKAAPEPHAPEEIIDAIPEAAGDDAEDALIEDAEELGGTDDVDEAVVEKDD